MSFTVVLSVVDILNGERFRFPIQNNSLYRVKHLKQEISSLVTRSGEFRLLIIRDGRVLEDENYLIPPYTTHKESNVIEFFMMAQPKEAPPRGKITCVLDEKSHTAAKDWLATHSSYTNEAEIRKMQNMLQVIDKLVVTTPENVNVNENDNIPNVPAAVPANEVADIQWFNSSVIMRLVVGFFLFVQGSTYQRILMYAVGKLSILSQYNKLVCLIFVFFK